MIVKNLQPVEDVYDIAGKKLGEGTYGAVRSATHRDTGQKRAIKQIPRSKIKNWERFQTEVKILQTMDHPNVIKLFEYFEDDVNVYLVTEICEGGELFDRIIAAEFFDEQQAANIFRQILMALNYCHSEKVCHRDLKPENFLFVDKSDDSDLKIIDFGLSKIIQAGSGLKRMKTRAGTPYYISPEVLSGSYDMSCDMWSAGCMLYILLCGYPPFYGDDNQEILQMVQTGKFDFDGEEWDDISNDAKDLIKKLICKPEVRLTAEEALKHRWVRNLTKKAVDKGAIRKLNVNNMKKFQKGEKLKQVALMAIAVQIDPNDVIELKKIFQELDKDGNGSVSLEELHTGLGERENGEQLLTILQAADTDGNGTINYTEFIAATMDAKIFMRDSYLKTAFNMFDTDNSGKISGDEINKLLSGDEFKDIYTPDQLAEAIAEVDKNGDGEIDFEEFMEMMKSIK